MNPISVTYTLSQYNKVLIYKESHQWQIDYADAYVLKY